MFKKTVLPVRLMFLYEWLHEEPGSVHGVLALGTPAGAESLPVLNPPGTRQEQDHSQETAVDTQFWLLGSVSDPVPYWILIKCLSGSGSRYAKKNTHKNADNFQKASANWKKCINKAPYWHRTWILSSFQSTLFSFNRIERHIFKLTPMSCLYYIVNFFL